MTKQTDKDDGGPAFATNESEALGLSIRDWFAGQAIGPLTVSKARENHSIFEDTKLAYEIADAMLTARKDQS